MNLNILNNEKEKIADIITKLASAVRSSLQKKTNIIIAVSGGKSPINLYQQLSQTDLPWANIIITLTDERIVDTSHVDSNENLIRTHLLINKAKSAKFIGLVDIKLNICEMLLKSEVNVPDIDIAILGMGEDGHTASIFSNCTELSDALNLENRQNFININPLESKYSRISLTLSALRKIPFLFLSISGELKLDVFQESIKENNNNYPISYLLNLRNDIQTFWCAQ